MKKNAMVFAGVLFLFMLAVNVHSQNSVLSEGSWYKLSTDEYGMYKITYDDFVNFGIDPTTINPKFIRLYGNGNGMLPEDLEEFRYEDLMENAILVVGEEDESFDPDDYILFYGEGPVEWQFDNNDGSFIHEQNLYSDLVFYFLNYDISPGKRVETQYSTIIPQTYISATFDDYYIHELDEENLIHSGKEWYGEQFGETMSYSYNLSFPELVAGSELNLKAEVAARCFEPCSFDFMINGETNLQLPVLNVNPVGTVFGRSKSGETNFNIDDEEFNLTIQFNSPDDSSLGWLNYFKFNFKRNLSFDLNMFRFRDTLSSLPGTVSRFKISDADDDCSVWNITDPLNAKMIEGEINSGAFEFILETDSLFEFVGFKNEHLEVSFIEEVENQNLHGLEVPELVILSHETFLENAYEISSFREDFDDISSVVVTPDQIYNEFSSGRQDITAIRDFIKYLADKGQQQDYPQYLFLIGDASYDYKDRVEDNTNFIPVWQSKESLNLVNSYCTDDYFGIFGDNISIGIGRIPVTSLAETNSVIQKIIHYSTSENSTGSWRNNVSFVADDEDGNLHLEQAEEISSIFNGYDESWNIDKIYLDAYPQDSLENGMPVYPLVNQAITDNINNGTLILHYTGHGHYEQLAHEKVLTFDDLGNWENNTSFPFMVNATGDIARFDDPDKFSLTEGMLLMDEQGMVGVQAPTRLTYAGANFSFQMKYFEGLLNHPDWRLGDLLVNAKSQMGGGIENKAKHLLFGDPSMKLAISENLIGTTTVNSVDANYFNDTIHPGEQIQLEGLISDSDGNVLYDFNGEIEIKVFDRERVVSTLANDLSSYETEFILQDSILLVINVIVTNGEFSTEFNLPINLNEEFGNIKLSYYASDGIIDARGYYSDIIVGGQPSSTLEYQEEFVSLYPTITNGPVNFVINETVPSLKIEVSDLSGKVVMKKTLNMIQKRESGNLNLSHLKNGFYIIRMYNGEVVNHFKIVKN